MTHYNRAEVDRRLDRLRAESDPTVDRETVELDPEEFDGFADQAAEGYTGGYASVVREEPPPLSASMHDVDEPYPRVLLALGRGADGWGPAGGGREADERYETAAVREVREETGVECSVVDCRRVRRTTFERADDGSESENGDEDVIHTLWVSFLAWGPAGASTFRSRNWAGRRGSATRPSDSTGASRTTPGRGRGGRTDERTRRGSGGTRPSVRAFRLTRPPSVFDELDEDAARIAGVEEGDGVAPRAPSWLLVDALDAPLVGPGERRLDVVGGEAEVVDPRPLSVEVVRYRPLLVRGFEYLQVALAEVEEDDFHPLEPLLVGHLDAEEVLEEEDEAVSVPRGDAGVVELHGRLSVPVDQNARGFDAALGSDRTGASPARLRNRGRDRRSNAGPLILSDVSPARISPPPRWRIFSRSYVRQYQALFIRSADSSPQTSHVAIR